MKFKYLKVGVMCALMPAFAMAQTDSISITGKINPSHDGETVMMIYGSLKKNTMAQTIIKDGTIAFKIPDASSKLVFLSMGTKLPHDGMSIYVAQGDITFVTSDSLKNAVVKGYKLTEDYSRMNAPLVQLNSQKAVYDSQLTALPPAERSGEKGIAIKARIINISRQEKAAVFSAIDKNPNSYIALFMLKNIAGGVINYDLIMPHYARLSNELKNSEEGKAFGEKIMAAKAMRAGLKATNFESMTPEGKKLSLQDVIVTGKYTLVDFWASWCVPCRAENPNVVKAYHQFHDKGFNVLSVSLDTKAGSWKAAIVKDGMPWNHVSTLLGWKDPVVTTYGIQAIPQNILVDAKGIIVATNLRGEDLTEKLSELLKAKN